MYLKNDRIFIALSIMLDIAFYAGSSGIVNALDLAQRTGFLKRGMEPILQALTRGLLLESIRGPKGGYRLARSEKFITLKEIIVAIHKDKDEEFLLMKGGDEKNQVLAEYIISPLWMECNKILEAYFHDITLADLLEKARNKGLDIPSDGPIFFSI